MDTLAQLIGFDDHERLSLQSFLYATTVPIIQGSGGQAAVRGTGTLFDYSERLFLVTAAHVLQNVDLQQLGMPPKPQICRALYFGNAKAWWPKDDRVDVAIVEIRDSWLQGELRRGWRVLDSSNVIEHLSGDSFVVAGYPRATVKQVGGGILMPSTMTQLFTGRYQGELPDNRTEHDFFLTFGHSAKGADGAVTTPELEGLSGASVWAIGSGSGLWQPDAILKVAGIQVSYVHSRYLRATSWFPICDIVEQITATH